MDRDLHWDGCLNVRDLGGLPTNDGRRTRLGSVVRMDNPAFLTPKGWSALHAYGVRTIVALRTLGADDDDPDPALMPDQVAIVRTPVEDLNDLEFKERFGDSGLWGTPLYFADALQRWQQLCVGAVAKVAGAPAGGVAISCGRGCDRTGLITMLLLSLAGVSAADIASDWQLSVDRLRPRDPSFEVALRDILDREKCSIESCFDSTLSSFDCAQYLRVGGMTSDEIEGLRDRLMTQRLNAPKWVVASPPVE